MNPLSGYSWGAAGYTLAVAALAFTLTYARTKSWGVGFLEAQVLRALFAPNAAARIRVAVRAAYTNFLRLERAGAYCHDDLHLAGRALVLYGFAGVALFSLAGFAAAHIRLEAALPATLALQAISSLVFAAGGAILLGRRMLAPHRRAATTREKWATHTLIVLFGAASASSSILGVAGPASAAAHAATLAAYAAFTLYAPFSDIAFLLWKGSYLVLKELEAFEEKSQIRLEGVKAG